MRLTISGLWRARPCTITWDDGRVTTEPAELLSLLRFHAWLHREGLFSGERDEADGDATTRSVGRGELENPVGMLEVARSLLDAIVIAEDTLGTWAVEERVPVDPFADPR